MKTNCLKHSAVAMMVAGLLAGCGQKLDAMESAKESLAKNDRAAAVIHLRNALQKNPNLAEARFLLGKAQLQSGEFAAAQKELRLALELGYSPDAVVPPLAEAMFLSHEYKQVIDEFGKTEAKTPEAPADLPAPLAAAMQQLGVAASKEPDRSRTVVLTTPEARGALQTTLGRAYLALGNVEGAKTAFAGAIAATPDSAPAILGVAQIQAAAKDFPGALATIDAALAKTPAFAEGWLFKGNWLETQGEREGALVAYRKAIGAKPDMVSAHAAAVTLLLREGKIEETAAQIEAMKKVAPKDAQTYFLQGVYAYSRKDLPAAHDAAEQLLRVAPDNLRALLLASSVDYQLNSFVPAEANLVKIVRQAPAHIGARRLLIATYLKLDQPAKALDTLKPVLGRVDMDPGFLALAGKVYLGNGQPAEAARYFSKVVADDPQSAAGHMGLAASHLAKGDVDSAFRELESASANSAGGQAEEELIRLALSRREFDKALAAIDALERKQPNAPQVRNLRGVALLGKQDVAAGRKSFQQALAIDPAYFPAAANLARMDLADKKPEDAKKRFEGVLAKDPKNAQALLALAELRARTGGTPDEVAAIIERTIAADPTAVHPRLTLISHWLRANNVKKAMSAGQDALTALPNNPQILEALARLQLDTGETEQALATYNNLVRLQPTSPRPLLLLAEAQVAAKNREAALQTLRKALTLKPDLVLAKRAIVILERDAGRVAQAVAMARDIQKQLPKESLGYVLEGDVHALKAAWNDAATSYRTGLKQAGTVDLAIKLYGALVAAGNSTEGERVASTWIKEHPNDAAFRLYLAQIALGKKDYNAAALQYKALLAAHPDNAPVLNDLAWWAGQAKDPNAIEYAQRAYKVAPDEPAVLDTLGVLLVEKGDKARGIELLQKAVKLAPASPSIRLSLAKALIAAGKTDAAKKELEELAKLGDKFESQADVAELMKAN